MSYTFPLLLIAVAGAVAAVIAASSGEELEESVREAANRRVDFGEHPEQGETSRNFAILFAFAVAAFWAIQQWAGRFHLKGWTVPASYAIASILGAVALGTIILAGHSGAALVWKDVGNFVSGK